MQEIYLANIPHDSLLKELGFNDFSDCVGTRLERTDIDIHDLVNCFFTASPGFVTQLMKLRDFMVGAVGLKTGNYTKTEHVTFEPGKEMGLFKMFEQNDHEAIIGADDKHLNFRVSLYTKPEGKTTEILLSTVVLFHNKWGKLYMGIISPFHKIIVNSMLKKIKKTLMALPEKSKADKKA